MLPARHRLREPSDFRAVVRSRTTSHSGPDASRARGARAGSPLLVVHVQRAPARVGRPTRVGFVVSKAVGGAVTRNRTKRVLRHLVAARLRGQDAVPSALPEGLDVVVRATPAAGTASSAQLGAELDGLLARVVPKVGAPVPA